MLELSTGLRVERHELEDLVRHPDPDGKPSSMASDAVIP